MTFHADKHIQFIKALDKQKDLPEYVLSEHLRLNAVYWAVTALDLLDALHVFENDKVIEYVLSCQSSTGGFGGHTGHDPHMLYTLSAIQILAIYDALDKIDIERVTGFIVALQNKSDGSFSGDEWGETDTRLTYCAISALSILNKLHLIDTEKTAQYFEKCKNFDGGYGSSPGGESHSVFCSVGALFVLKRQDLVDAENLGFWLSERQLPGGGLNGRPEKLQDVCYSWWVLSSLTMLGKDSWINKDKLIQFILESQSSETGGMADRPGHSADVFHTLFGIAGLSMLEFPGLKEVDPRYCMPRHVTKRLGL